MNNWTENEILSLASSVDQFAMRRERDTLRKFATQVRQRRSIT